jgi:putative Mg2+ transporter-C (MgtC) family protein
VEDVARALTEQEIFPARTIGVRLLGAVLLCAVIGLEREWTQHPAGLRTHMLVGLATAIFALLTLTLMGTYGGQQGNIRLDPMRVLQAIGAAVGLIAAGVVVFARGELKGLTTSAGIWVASGIGLCAGFGLWVIAGIAALLALVINLVLKLLEDWLLRR